MFSNYYTTALISQDSMPITDVNHQGWVIKYKCSSPKLAKETENSASL